MRLGGFVIHGNAGEGLAPCLDSLRAVCDDVVAIDSNSTDGSAAVVASRGVRSSNVPWQGYGAARAAAVTLLGPGFDYLMFLDADEYLDARAREAITRWKCSAPSLEAYKLKRRNWARVMGREFVYRIDRRARLVRADMPLWRPEMIVHEALPGMRTGTVDGFIEHSFFTSAYRFEKDRRYALLWAIQSGAEGKRAKWPPLQQAASFIRDAVFGGALMRGGATALKVAWRLSSYHALKYQMLREVQAGRYAELSKLYEQRALEALFRALPE